MTAQSDGVPSALTTGRPVDDIMEVLLAETTGIQPAFALRRAYEEWTRQAFSPNPDRAISPNQRLRARARATGRVLSLLEDTDKFPRAAHRLSGRLRTTRDQARYLLMRLFEIWNLDNAPTDSIDPDLSYVRDRVENLLDQIFVRKGVEVPYVTIPATKTPESTLLTWTAETFRDAECVMVVSSEAVIVGESEVTATERFVNSSMPSVLEHLNPSGVWIWLIDLGLGRGNPDWHMYLNMVRLYGALAAFAHHLKFRRRDEPELLRLFLSNCFVGLRAAPNAPTRALQHFKSVKFDDTNFDVHVNLEKLFAVPASEKDYQGVSHLAIGVKDKNKQGCEIYLPNFSVQEGNRSAHSNPSMAVVYEVRESDDEFARAFDLVYAAALRLRSNAETGSSEDTSPEELVLLTRGMELFSVDRFLKSEWLGPLDRSPIASPNPISSE